MSNGVAALARKNTMPESLADAYCSSAVE